MDNQDYYELLDLFANGESSSSNNLQDDEVMTVDEFISHGGMRAFMGGGK